MNSNHCMNIHANKKIVSRGVLHADALGYKITIKPYIVYSYFNLGCPPSKAEKSNTSAKGCWGSLINSFIYLLAIPSSLSRSY
jgi:hypothetical protein